MQRITHYGQALAARARVLRDDGERGAQAAEYALLGGVSAAACGALIKVLQDNPEIFSRVLTTVVRMLGRAVGGWF